MQALSQLFELKLTILRNHWKTFRKKPPLEVITLITFVLIALGGLFWFFQSSFQFFQAQEPFGPLLIEEVFYLFNFSIFMMLLISSGVSAYTSLFKSGEVAFLMTRPVTWADIFMTKLAENIWLSSWALFLLIIPFMFGYGSIKNVGLYFPLLCMAFYIPFAILAGTLGTLISTVIVFLLPGRKSRNTVFLLLLGAVIYWFIKAQPEFVKEQGSIAGILSGYLPNVAFAKNPIFPSYWLTRGILILSDISNLTSLRWWDGTFYLLVLLANTFFFFIPCYSASQTLYPVTYYRNQDHAEGKKTRKVLIRSGMEKLFDRLPWPSRPAFAYLEKDIKTFARDPSEWAQLIIFFGLLILYFANLRNLEFHYLKDFWKNLIFVLNTVGTYIVLSSFSMRFVFPMISLEGNCAYIIGLSPSRFSTLLLVKFFLGTFVSALLTLPLVYFSGWMLDIPLRKIVYTTGLGFFVCVALTGLSVGFGAKFPNFKSNNPAAIISGFGGSFLLVCHLLYLGAIGAFLGLNSDPGSLILLSVAFGSLLVGMLPIRMGARALAEMEF